MGLKKTLMKKAAPVVAAVTVALAPNATAQEKETDAQTPEEKNVIEQVVHTTTKVIDKTVNVVANTADVPLQVTKKVLDTAAIGTMKLVDAAGRHTGEVGKTIAYHVNEGIAAVNNVAELPIDTARIGLAVASNAVGLATAPVDALATATRDPKEAAIKLAKEEAITATNTALLANMTAGGTALMALSIASNAVTIANDATQIIPEAVKVIDNDAGEKVQKTKDVLTGTTALATGTAAITTTLVAATPAFAQIAIPHVGEAIEDVLLEKVAPETEPETQEAQVFPQKEQLSKDEAMERLQEHFQKLEEEKNKSVPQKIVDGLANLGKKVRKWSKEDVAQDSKELSKALSEVSLKDVATNVNLNVFDVKTTGRDLAKKVVDRSEKLRKDVEEQKVSAPLTPPAILQTKKEQSDVKLAANIKAVNKDR